MPDMPPTAWGEYPIKRKIIYRSRGNELHDVKELDRRIQFLESFVRRSDPDVYDVAKASWEAANE